MAKKFSQNAVVLVLYDLYQRAAAFAAFYCNDSEKRIAYLSMIAVKAGYKRLGYGTALLNKVCEIAGHCGMQKLRLEVAKENATAIRFYQRAGFRQFMENSESLFLEISLDERVK